MEKRTSTTPLIIVEEEGEESVSTSRNGNWEECPICMEPVNYGVSFAQYWLCCGQRMCETCNKFQWDMTLNRLVPNRGERRVCPFCRSPEIYDSEPMYQSQLLKFAEKGKSWANGMLGERYREGYGHGVKYNMKKSLYYCNLAAEQGCPMSTHQLGNFYRKGEAGV